MSNPLSRELITGTVAELFVQIRLLQFKVQAAPPLKDSGNDLIAIRGRQMRSIQVKATASASYRIPKKNRKYDILAAVHFCGENHRIDLEASKIFLIGNRELKKRSSRRFSAIPKMELDSTRIDELFSFDSKGK